MLHQTANQGPGGPTWIGREHGEGQNGQERGPGVPARKEAGDVLSLEHTGSLQAANKCCSSIPHCGLWRAPGWQLPTLANAPLSTGPAAATIHENWVRQRTDTYLLLVQPHPKQRAHCPLHSARGRKLNPHENTIHSPIYHLPWTQRPPAPSRRANKQNEKLLRRLDQPLEHTRPVSGSNKLKQPQAGLLPIPAQNDHTSSTSPQRRAEVRPFLPQPRLSDPKQMVEINGHKAQSEPRKEPVTPM